MDPWGTPCLTNLLMLYYYGKHTVFSQRSETLTMQRQARCSKLIIQSVYMSIQWSVVLKVKLISNNRGTEVESESILSRRSLITSEKVVSEEWQALKAERVQKDYHELFGSGLTTAILKLEYTLLIISDTLTVLSILGPRDLSLVYLVGAKRQAVGVEAAPV